MDIDNFEDEYVTGSLVDGVLYMKYKIEYLDINAVKSAMKSRLEFSNGVTYPLFVDISSVKNTSQEARVYSSSGDAVKLISAAALWGSSELTKVIANFFMAFNKPKVPLKFFSDRNKAEIWLKQFVK